MANNIYTTSQFSSIISSSQSLFNVEEIKNYILENAVEILKQYGVNYYNMLVFSVKEKERAITQLSA